MQADLPGFGFIDPAGNTRGVDVDMCRAVAAAIFGDPTALEIQHISYAERGPLFQAGEIEFCREPLPGLRGVVKLAITAG